MADEQDADAMGRPRTTSVYLVSKRYSCLAILRATLIVYESRLDAD